MPARVLNPALDAATVVQVLIETPLGIANASTIAAVDGVDILAIGANDLLRRARLRWAVHINDPRLRDAVAAAAEACRRHGKLLMVGGISDLDLLAPLVALGAVPLMLTGTDTDMLFAGRGGARPPVHRLVDRPSPARSQEAPFGHQHPRHHADAPGGEQHPASLHRTRKELR